MCVKPIRYKNLLPLYKRGSKAPLRISITIQEQIFSFIHRSMASRGPRIQALDLPWLLQLIFLFSTFMISSCYSPPLRKIPRLSILQRPITFRNHSNSVAVRHRFRTYFYAQTLDHFSYEPASYTTFLQRYMVSSMHWRGALAAAPIFVYLGGEESLEESIGSIGFLTDNAQKFGALMVYLEVSNRNDVHSSSQIVNWIKIILLVLIC